jgi:hypothetical protein
LVPTRADIVAFSRRERRNKASAESHCRRFGEVAMFKGTFHSADFGWPGLDRGGNFPPG